MRSSFPKVIYLLLTIYFSTISEAHAYIDLGSGSFIFQIIIAYVIGFFITAKLFWKKVIAFFKRIFKK